MKVTTQSPSYLILLWGSAEGFAAVSSMEQASSPPEDPKGLERLSLPLGFRQT